MIGIVWSISCLWALPIIGWHHWYNDGVRKHGASECETEFSDNVVFKLTTSAANFFIPMILMVVLYYKIFREIKRRGKFDIGRSMSISCAIHAGSLSRSSKKRQKRLFRASFRPSTCSSTSFSSFRSHKNKHPPLAGQLSVPSESDMQSKKVPPEGNERKERNEGTDVESTECIRSNKAEVTALSDADKIKHFQQLTLMTVTEPKKATVEDYEGVRVEVEYVNGGSTLSKSDLVKTESVSTATTTASVQQSSETSKKALNKEGPASILKQPSITISTSTEAKKCKVKKRFLSRSPSNSSAGTVQSVEGEASSGKSKYTIRLCRKNKLSKAMSTPVATGNKSEKRSSLAVPLNDLCNECQCAASAAAAASYHQNALRREESSRLRQEKKAARQLGVILGKRAAERLLTVLSARL